MLFMNQSQSPKGSLDTIPFKMMDAAALYHCGSNTGCITGRIN